MDLDCDLVIPCRDEAAALPGVLRRVPAGMGIVVVDNGSTDGTADVARALGARVVHEFQLGYGAAVHRGIEFATAQFVAVLDGDGSMDPRGLLPLLEEVRSGRATMALGRRRPAARGVWPGTPGPGTRSSWPGCAAAPASLCTTSHRFGSAAARTSWRSGPRPPVRLSRRAARPGARRRVGAQ